MNMNKKEILLLMELLLITLFSVCFYPVFCIVERDLVLTPRQGLQLNGKSIYYEEDTNEVLRNLTVRPWERTLKHVTFVTLFTDAAASAVAGNISKLKEYSDFLESPYISNENANTIRFGDIVMLANGRLEKAKNNTFRFIEGTCGYDCEPERVWAIWQVQKIRHRDQNQNFRYEMKFSISPLRTESQLSELREQTPNVELQHGDMYVRRNALKTYIQREDDYPQSFGRIIYPEEISFAQKRHDDGYISRNFRQVSGSNDYRQVTPLPQSTFMYGVYQPHPGITPPPPPPPHPQRLNIGEYVKGFTHAKATPKIELFPNHYNLMNRNTFQSPTTFRPNYQIKLPIPDIYQPPPDIVRFPENRNEMNFVGNKMNPPLVTHHFHHHFFMPGNEENSGNNSGENHISSAEQQESEQVPKTFYKQINRQVTPNYYYEATSTPKQESNLLSSPQKVSFPIVNIGEQIVEVTPPPPPLKKSQIYMAYRTNFSGKIPVLVYAATAPIVATSTTTARPFIQSEPITDSFRYSEPDPLYANDGQNGAQLETPHYNTEATSNVKGVQTQETVEEQLTSPEKEKEISENNFREDNLIPKGDQILNESQKDLHISTNNESNSTAESIHAITTTTSTTTTSNPIISPPRHATTPLTSTTKTPIVRIFAQNSEIISTSTTENPLRAVSRIRNGRPPTTTVEPSIARWKPKRRNHHSNLKFNTHHKRNDDTKSKSITRREELLTLENKNFNLTTSSPNPLHKGEEVLEVLTQKSVSKSVSVKVGEDGEEILLTSEDGNVAENEVKKD